MTGEVVSAAGNFVGRYPPSELQLLAYADHADTPPMTLAHLAEAFERVSRREARDRPRSRS